jgi:DNA-binding transcriptional regulator YbjK
MRGEASSRALVDATLRILERDGIAGVSYRAVAREAEVSANAVAYYFGSIDALLLESIRNATQTWAETMAAVRPAHFAADLSALLVSEAASDRRRLVAEFELYLLAGRKPALRQAARAWADALLVPLGDLSDVERRKLIAVIDGLYVQLLLADDGVERDVLAAIINDALPARHQAVTRRKATKAASKAASRA